MISSSIHFPANDVIMGHECRRGTVWVRISGKGEEEKRI
jgi:hypothetical protein